MVQTFRGEMGSCNSIAKPRCGRCCNFATSNFPQLFPKICKMPVVHRSLDHATFFRAVNVNTRVIHESLLSISAIYSSIDNIEATAESKTSIVPSVYPAGNSGRHEPLFRALVAGYLPRLSHSMIAFRSLNPVDCLGTFTGALCYCPLSFLDTELMLELRRLDS